MATRENPFAENGAPKVTEPPAPGGPVSRETRADPRPRQRHQWRPVSEMPADTENDRLHIDKSDYPDGFDLQWVTASIFGQPQPNHFSRFERRGYEPVHGDDFEARYDGRFTPVGHKGPIEVDGMVLMARPMEWTLKAKSEDRRRAAEAIAIKEKQLRGGDIEGVGMDGGAQHPSALGVNRIRRSYERLQVPKD